MSPNGINLDFLSRFVLAFACLGSCLAAGSLAWITHPKYTPHLILVSFWSAWAGMAMMSLAFPRFEFPVLGPGLLIVNLNGAFIVTVGGWSFFAVRLWNEARSTRIAHSDLAEALQLSLDAATTVLGEPADE